MRLAPQADITRAFLAGVAICVPLLATAAGAGADNPEDLSQPVQDAWIDGRLETTYALNEQLRLFNIATEVENGTVRLTGTLETEIDRDLAIQIAEGVDGVREVESALTVSGARPADPVRADGAKRSFGQWVDDATSTARVRSNLAANGNTRGLSIEVDTENDVVILKGAVPSRKEKMLAEMIARNTDGIASVRNQLAAGDEQP